MHESIPLNALSAGENAVVTDVVAQPDTVHRLEEIGLRQGAVVEMISAGSPCIIRLAGQRLCVRADELLRVLVRPGVVA